MPLEKQKFRKTKDVPLTDGPREGRASERKAKQKKKRKKKKGITKKFDNP